MNIDWAHFTPLPSFMGGVMIGFSAMMFVVLKGRIAGVSGILGGLLEPQPKGERGWRLMFIVGLLLAPWLYRLFADSPALQMDASHLSLVVAGLLVGLGTRYGAGCTSGHGICGMSRLSGRSMVATACFMLTGFVTVYLLRHVFGG